MSFLLCTLFAASGQMSAVYSLDNISGKSTDCCIYFYKNGVYEIMSEEQESDYLIVHGLKCTWSITLNYNYVRSY